jgi:hypothetical protein
VPSVVVVVHLVLALIRAPVSRALSAVPTVADSEAMLVHSAWGTSSRPPSGVHSGATHSKVASAAALALSVAVPPLVPSVAVAVAQVPSVAQHQLLAAEPLKPPHPSDKTTPSNSSREVWAHSAPLPGE